MSDSDENSSSQEESAEETQAVATYGGPVEPYQHEPLAHDTDTDSESPSDHELDIDGLSPAILRARYEKNIDVKDW